MSIYTTLDAGIPAFLASNQGWGDLGRWVDTLDPADYGELVHLREHGWSQDLETLAGQLRRALLVERPNQQTVATTARALLATARIRHAEVLTITDGLGKNSAPRVDFCGGPGGAPGPCPAAGSVETKRATILERAKGLPRAAVDKAVGYVKGKYDQLEQRYGRRYALAIMGAGLVGVPVPVPGASLATALPVIGIAELHRRLSGAHAEIPAGAQVLTPAIRTLGQRFVRDVLQDWPRATS